MNYTAVFSKLTELQKYLSQHPWLLCAIAVVLVLLSIVCSRHMNRLFFVLYLFVILYLTFFGRSVLKKHSASLRIFNTYKYFLKSAYFRREILNNIFLFIPFGAITARLQPKWSTLLLSILLSALIELLQFTTKLGLLEVDDVISNSLGGLIGLSAVMLRDYVIRSLRLRTGSLSKKL